MNLDSLVSHKPVDCKTVRIFACSSTRELSNRRSGTRLKTESETGERRKNTVFFSRLKRPTGVRLARFARVRLLRHAFPISLLILKKNPTVLQSTGPRRVLTGFPVHSLPVVPAGSLSSLLLLLVRKGKTPPLALRLCFTLGLPTTGLIAPGTCLDGNPIPGLSGALIELARLMLSGLSLVSNPLNVSALLGPFDPGPVTASDGVLPRVSLWGSSNEAPSNDTCWIAVTRDSLRTKDNYTQLKNEDSTVGTLYRNEIFLTTNKFLKVTQTFQ